MHKNQKIPHGYKANSFNEDLSLKLFQMRFL